MANFGSDPVRHIIYVHSGGTDPVTGEPSLASKERLEQALRFYRDQGMAILDVLLVVSGEQTRKSGPWEQGPRLAEFARRIFPDGMPIKAYGLNMDEIFRALARDCPEAAVVHFVNDDIYLDVYRWRLRLVNEGYARKLRMVPVATGPAYAARYSPRYQTCTKAGLYARLAMGYLKARRPEVVLVGVKALSWTFKAWLTVGSEPLTLFLQDRRLNKESSDPAVQAQTLRIRKRLIALGYADLLGE